MSEKTPNFLCIFVNFFEKSFLSFKVSLALVELPDAVGGAFEVVIPASLHEGKMKCFRHGLDMVGGKCRGWPEYGGHSRLHQVAQLLAGFEAVVLGVGGRVHEDPGPGERGSVIIDQVNSSLKRSFLRARLFIKQSS